MHRSSPRLVSLPLEKLQAAGCRPRQADEGADVHAVLALTWSEGMAAVHTQIQKLFFLYIKTGNKAPCIAKQSLYLALSLEKDFSELAAGIVS